MRNKFLNVVFICLTVSVCSTVSAQTYLQATVYFRSGQSETGKVYYSNWTVTPQEIRFINDSGVEKKCVPGNVEKVEVKRKDGKFEYFRSAAVFVNRSSTKIADLEPNYAARLELDTVFLQTLLRSAISIYMLKENDTEHLFVEKDTIQTLIYKQYRPDPNIPVLSVNNRYRQQLLALMYDDAALQKSILAAEYQKRDLLKIVRAYNEHAGNKISYEYRRESVKVRLYVGAGVSLSSLTKVDYKDKISYKIETSRQPATLVTPVLGVVVPVPRTNGRFLLSNDFHLSKSDYFYDLTPNYPLVYDPKLEKIVLDQLQMHTFLRWKTLDKQHKFFLIGGMFNNWIYRDKSQLSISTVGGEYDKIQRKYDLGLVGGLNYGYKRLSIDLRYQLEKGRANTADINTALQRFAAILMYNL